MRGLGACWAPGQSQVAAPCHRRDCDTALHPCLHRRDACCSQGGVQDWPMCVGGRCTRMDVHPGICCLHRVAGSWHAGVLQAGGDTATPFTASRCGAAEPPHKTRKTPFGTGTVCCCYQGACNSCGGLHLPPGAWCGPLNHHALLQQLLHMDSCAATTFSGGGKPPMLPANTNAAPLQAPVHSQGASKQWYCVHTLRGTASTTPLVWCAITAAPLVVPSVGWW